MSLIPAFEIGVWNAWILMLSMLVPLALLPFINKSTTKSDDTGHAYNKTDKQICGAFHVIFFLLLIYSIFLPLKPGTIWFYAGLSIYLLGLVIYIACMVSFATVPIDTKPMTKGIYRYSRHPLYVSSSLILAGTSIACASWIFLLFSVAYAVLSLISAIPEERSLLEKYGDAYREYIDRTPRWIGLPKSG